MVLTEHVFKKIEYSEPSNIVFTFFGSTEGSI